ncbi:MAG TPA: GDSL-type esterase/lipase family protein, partial [Herpetosiphonaceae bacterium]|nr:GDSL-type esterase/lipase family protein [Herpetosiphonaceae bacterium]
MGWKHTRLALLRLVGLAALVGLIGSGRGAGAQAERAAIDPERVGYPQSLAALGDSITRAFLSVPINYPSEQPSDAPQNSWSSGTEAAVNSHYSRIRAAQPLIDGKNNNFAATGSNMSGLAGQVNQAVAAKSDYVTILLGANDVCTGSEGSMTAVATFRSQFSAGLTALSAGLPDARILVVGVPDIYKVWELAHSNQQAQLVWNTFGVCQSMFQNPASTDQADVYRRARVRQRNIDFNTQLSEVCAQFIHCRYSDVLFTSTLEAADLAQDFYHPSIAGQAKLAAATYG